MWTETLAMAALSSAGVGLWTLRVAVAARGLKTLCALVASAEALLFAVTFSRLVSDLATPGRIFGYLLGVAAGSVAGLWIDDRVGRQVHSSAPERRQAVDDLSRGCRRVRAKPLRRG